MGERGTEHAIEHELRELRESQHRMEWTLLRMERRQELNEQLMLEILREIRDRLRTYPRTSGGQIRVT